MDVNYWVVLAGAVLSLAVGAIWFGPIFGPAWMSITGADKAMKDPVARKAAMRGMWKTYLAQFLLSLFQVYILAHFVRGWTDASGAEVGLWVWAAFVMPTIATTVMWSNLRESWPRFFIQASYQLVLFVLLGLLLEAGL